MNDAVRRAGALAAPVGRALLVAGGATVVAALVEALWFGDAGALGWLAAAGYALRHGLLPGALALLVIRGLLASWRVDEQVRRWTRPDGTAPQLAAWLAWLVIATAALTLALLWGTEAVVAATRAPAAIALSVMAGGAVVVALVAAATPLAVRSLARAMTRWPATPRAAWGGFAVAIVGAAAAGYVLVVRPRIGYLELGAAPFALAWLAAVASGYRVAPRLAPRALGLAAGAIVAAAILSFVGARYAVAERLDIVLAVWGDLPVAGRAIERSHDLYALRDRGALRTVAPVAASDRHPNVVLVTVDTARADRTPLLGGPAAMPALEGLARVGATFEWALAPSNVTRRSIPALVTGASPFRVRGRVAGWALRLDPRHVLLAERFAAAGYDTAGFACCESFFAERHRLGWIRGLQSVYLDRDGRRLSERALEWMAGRERPFFVWVHVIEPHQWETDYPSRAHPGEARERRYDRGLTAADRALAPLLTHLANEAQRRDTLVAVTSDHGEGLGDHGAAYHATDLYNSQVRVPLVVAGPGIARGARVRTPVGLVDVAPTLLDLAGFEPPGMPDMDGRSFAALLDDDPVNDGAVPGEAYVVMVADRSVARSRWSLLFGRHKLIAPAGRDDGGAEGVELYDVREDPDERENLARARPDVVDRLLERLEARRAVDAVPAF